MTKITVVCIVLAGTLLPSCKKEYSCHCFDPGGIFKTYTIKDTRKKADLQCHDYSAEYQRMPFSETACKLQ